MKSLFRIRNIQNGAFFVQKLEIAVKQTARMEVMVKGLLDFGRPLELRCFRIDV
jgi:hypothetical protein